MVVVIEGADRRGGRFKIRRCRHFLEDVLRWKEEGAFGVYEGGSVS